MKSVALRTRAQRLPPKTGGAWGGGGAQSPLWEIKDYGTLCYSSSAIHCKIIFRNLTKNHRLWEHEWFLSGSLHLFRKHNEKFVKLRKSCQTVFSSRKRVSYRDSNMLTFTQETETLTTALLRRLPWSRERRPIRLGSRKELTWRHKFHFTAQSPVSTKNSSELRNIPLVFIKK